MSTGLSTSLSAFHDPTARWTGTRSSARLVMAWLSALLLLAVAFLALPASAAVDLRVESRPISDPIQAYVTVTDASGNPVGGLTAGSFTVLLDGQAVTIPSAGFSLPPSQNPDKNVSIVFVMDFSSSTAGDPRSAMQAAVVDFVNAMNPGDYAAIVKFNGTRGVSVAQPFTAIGTGTAALVNAVMLPYDGTGSPVFDAISVSLDQFVAPPAGVTLPDGPKAVVLISDGLDVGSVNTQNFVTDKASSLGIPLFTIAVGTPGTTGSNLMNALAARTGGSYISAPTQAAVDGAYQTIATRLDNGYLLSFVSSITDCNPHTLTVTVAGHGTAETRFTRCDATTGSVTVPNVVNLSQSAASAALKAAGLAVGTVTQQSSATVAAGNVSSQNPVAGVGVTAGTAVNLVVSTGPAPPPPGPTTATVPNVVNLTQSAATTAIQNAGLVVGVLSQASSTTVPAGSVISQSPGSGTTVAAGSAVSMVVSTGPVVVLDVVNLTQAAATAAIINAGLAVGNITQQSSATVPAGSVISQNPAAGTGVAAGSAVGLVISTGPATPTPPPTGGGGGGGGGGSIGLGSLLLGLAALAARRRRRA